MNIPVAVVMNTEELLALPDDGVERELIRGQLREKPMTRRNPQHSEVVISVGYVLKQWLRQQPKPRGRLLGGEAGFRIRREPDTTVGIDVAYISAELAGNTPRKAGVVDGTPVLAVEVLSPYDKHEEISEKVQEYIDAGVPLVWVADPDFRTVRVHRPGAEPELFNILQELSGEPELPGFRVPVADIFDS
jgi:Uma2 family endonuclease